ncbi:tRNA1Val (adenine37-N6)-methyltransferase [Azospirillaceae bacterium]
MTILENDSLTLDRLLDGRVSIWQPRRGYRVAIDAVFLAAATPARPGERVLDVGTGVAAAALCLATRTPNLKITGLDLQPALLALGARNISLYAESLENAPAEKPHTEITLIEGDVRHPPVTLRPGSFDRVMANPPFLKPGTHTPAAESANALARGETEDADLETWIKFCAAMVRPRGTVTMIHRADRIDELLALLCPRFGGIVITPLWPRLGQPARRILATGRRDVHSPARLDFGMILHQQDGAYTPEAEAVLRHAHALSPLSSE